MVEILHKDRDFIVCVKPQGIPSQSDTTGSEDMASMLAQTLSDMNENSEIFVVHRLDRATGGLILYARNKSAAATFSNLVAEKDAFEKNYLAIVCGIAKEKIGSMSDYLYKDSVQKKAFVVKNERKGAKLASLDYEVLDVLTQADKGFSLVSINLHTGRFHQIRAQFSSRGLSIYGDGKYGSREKAPYFALWANKISFTYKGKHYEFEKTPDFSSPPWNLFNKT